MKQLLKSNKSKFKIKLEDDPAYYNLNKFFSYDFCDFAIIMGGRGIGKTTSALKCALNRFLKKGYEFIYLRRYRGEIKKFVVQRSLDKLVDDIIYKKNGDYCTIKYQDDTLGYAIPFSLANDFKSVNFDKVGTLIFDEAILPKKGTKRYLNGEAKQLLDFISTVFRTRKDYKVIIMGNNVDIFNPYFQYFEIPEFKDVYVDKKRGLFCELPKNSPKLLEKEKKTPLYKLTNGTDYAKYHYDNEYIESKSVVIKELPSNSNLMVRLIINGTLSIYFYKDFKTNKYMLHCTFTDSKIEDEKTIKLIIDDKMNYPMVALVKTRYRAMLYKFYYDNAITYSTRKAGDVLAWFIEKI